jgi:hypothetical protein
MNHFKTIFAAASLLTLTLAAQQPSSTKGSQADADEKGNSVHKIVLPQYSPDIPAGPNVQTYRNDCLTCHSARYVTSQPNFARTVWEKEVKKMVEAYGAPIPDADQQKIVDYLVAVKGPDQAGMTSASPAESKEKK